ncbi:MAG: hypothetical protein E6Z37_13165 [Serratia marcescens]|nr:hypothetical protein [Serratia marcescens]
MDNKLSELSKPVRIHRDWNRASMCHCGKCDRWKMTIADADGVQTCASCYDAEWLSEWQNYAEAAEKRIAELEAIRSDASQVFKEIGNELGCNPDNESIMMAIDALKEREKRVVALAGGSAELWETMAARLEAAEAKLATPVRLPTQEFYDDPLSAHLAIKDCANAIRVAGFIIDAGNGQPEEETPLAKMARIIRENPHPTNECDMPPAEGDE